MSRRASKRAPRSIDRLAMDSLLYGVSKSLDYLGEHKQAVLDKIGDSMLEYLIDSGRVDAPDTPREFEQSLKRLLVKNGFDSRIPLRFEGSPPVPSFPTFVDYLMPAGNHGTHDRTARSPGESPSGRGKVDWVLYEMALYGMTKVLDDQLGAQAQLILNQIGTEMLNYLVESGAIEVLDDPVAFFKNVKDFFMKGGFAGATEFRIEGSPPTALVATWTNARYYSNVLRRLRNEGSALFSCPVCLVGESILTRTQGLRFQNLVELKFLPGAKVYYRHKVFPPAERFTEEDAHRISRMTL